MTGLIPVKAGEHFGSLLSQLCFFLNKEGKSVENFKFNEWVEMNEATAICYVTFI